VTSGRRLVLRPFRPGQGPRRPLAAADHFGGPARSSERSGRCSVANRGLAARWASLRKAGRAPFPPPDPACRISAM